MGLEIKFGTHLPRAMFEVGRLYEIYQRISLDRKIKNEEEET